MKRFLSCVLPLLLSFGLIFNCTGCSTVLVLAGKARENSEASSSVISESSASSGVIWPKTATCVRFTRMLQTLKVSR